MGLGGDNRVLTFFCVHTYGDSILLVNGKWCDRYKNTNRIGESEELLVNGKGDRV